MEWGRRKDCDIVSFIPTKINISSISQVSCGFNYNIYLSYSGELYSSGINTYGELGLGHKRSVLQPKLIPNISNVTFIECASRSVVCKTNDNLFYSWGYNLFGQLMQGDTKTCLIPTLCKNMPDDVISVRSGTYHVLLLTMEGLVYGCGSNSNGQLGLKQNSGGNYTEPTKISLLPPIKKISCGYNHSMCIDINNSLWVFGYNIYGQLGVGHTKSIFTPQKICSDIMDVSCGGDTTFIKTCDSKIYAFGSNKRTILSQEAAHSITNKIEMLQGYEDIWGTKSISSRKKSARK